MSDIKLFRLTQGVATELKGDASDLEKPLQTLIENNLEPLLGIRFLATEYSTGKTHAGRIDSLGLDENACPVILEYKRSMGENVINQGLFYLDWLMDHQAEFELLVMKKLGQEAASTIDWTAPRLVCVAADFTKYDAHAVQQINRNIELIRYRMFGNELLLLEQANAASPASTSTTTKSTKSPSTKQQPASSAQKSNDKPYVEWVEDKNYSLRDLLLSIEDYMMSLGDDVQRKQLKLYVAFKRLKNFTTVVPQKSRILIFLHLSPADLPSLPPNSRDVSSLGHWGTGDFELSIATQKDLDAAKQYIAMAYQGK